MKVAFVGLGSMGAPQARLIARSGHDLAVYDPYPPALQKFEGVARLAASPADAAQGVEIACVCVRDDQQVKDVVLGENGLASALASGSLLLIHSTITIATLHELKAKLAPKGIALVDAPVSRTRRTDDDKFVFTMLGGEAADVERARAVVDTFATDLDHFGPLGAGMAAKIANNLVTWTHIVVGVQATNMAARHGVPYEKLRAIWTSNGNLTPSVGPLLDGKDKVPPGGDPARDELLASQAGIGEKDLSLAMACMAEAGLTTGMIAETRDLVRSVMTGALAKPAS